MRPAALVETAGGLYSTELGIRLSSGKSAEIYKWFLAALLFGARISETIAANTYREFARERLFSPRKIVDAGWDRLVEVLDRGGYVRYDFKTATKLLEVNRELLRQYKGNLNVLYAGAKDERELEQRLKKLGKGIGDVTVNIFLRELRGVWSKATPLPSDLVVDAARQLGYVRKDTRDKVRILEQLQDAWRVQRMPSAKFADFEASLVRYAITTHRKHARTESASGKRG